MIVFDQIPHQKLGLCHYFYGVFVQHDSRFSKLLTLILEFGTWSWYVCPLELRFLGSIRPAAGFTSTRPFMKLYIIHTLSDVLLDCGFSSWR